MKKLILLFLVFSHINLWAQSKVDSLQTVLSGIKGDERGQVLNQISSYLRQSDSMKCMNYARQALTAAQNSKNQSIAGNAYFNMAECQYYFDRYEDALKYYQYALDLFEKLNDRDKMAEIYNSAGLVHYYRGEYDRALENQINALRCLENSTDQQELAHVYSNMGMVYSRLGDYPRSIQNYRKAAVVNRRRGDLYSVAVNYNGIGVGYYNQGKPDSAKVSYQVSLSAFKLLNDREKIAIALNNIANIFVDKADSLDKALRYYEEALAVFEQLNDQRNKAFVLDGLGGAYRAMGDKDKALRTFHEGLELAKKHRLGFYIQQLYYKDIAATCEMQGNIRNAYSAYKLYKSYQDSLHQEEQMKQVAELEKKFETEMKEAEIVKLNAEQEMAHLQIQKDKAIRIFGMIVILLLLIIIIYVSFGYYEKKRVNALLNQKNEQIENQKTELEKTNAAKNKFFSIIAHDLKNPFHTVLGYSFLLSTEYERFEERDRKKYAGEIYKASDNIFRLLQNLLDWSSSQTGQLKYEPAEFDFKVLYGKINDLLEPIAGQKKISLNAAIPDDLGVYADPMMVEIVLRNLISNAVKFSYKESRVITEAKSNGCQQVIVSVRDQGKGISREDLQHLFRIDSPVKQKGTNGEKGSGLGLILCREFIHINQGKIWAESESGKGSTFYFSLPEKITQR